MHPLLTAALIGLIIVGAIVVVVFIGSWIVAKGGDLISFLRKKFK